MQYIGLSRFFLVSETLCEDKTLGVYRIILFLLHSQPFFIVLLISCSGYPAFNHLSIARTSSCRLFFVEFHMFGARFVTLIVKFHKKFAYRVI